MCSLCKLDALPVAQQHQNTLITVTEENSRRTNQHTDNTFSAVIKTGNVSSQQFQEQAYISANAIPSSRQKTK